ncbi:MAG: hypothetical protein ACOCRO_07275 [Halanaerobiales bacterium]
MILDGEIIVGNEVYGYDADNLFLSENIHKTVKILEEKTQYEVDYMGKHTENSYKLLTVECQQTGKIFTCGTHMLTTIPRIKRMLEAYKLEKDFKNDINKEIHEDKIKRMEDVLFAYELESSIKSDI